MWTYNYSPELYHHGILGMKWGKRRYQPYPKGHVGGKEVGEAAKKRSQVKMEKKERRQLKKAQAEWDKKVEKNWLVAYNRAIEYANEVLIPEINAKYTQKYGKNWAIEASANNSEAYQAYLNEYEELFNRRWDEETIKIFGKRPGSK